MATLYPLPTKFPLAQRKPLPGAFEKEIKEQIADLSGRIKVLEERIDTMRTHLELLDNTLVERHKTIVAEINDLKDSIRSIRADLEEVKDFNERLAKRMEALASKEELKVLERYVDAWQPLNYITRNELKATVKALLKDLGIKTKEK